MYKEAISPKEILENIIQRKSYSNHIMPKDKKYSLVPDMISGWKP